MGKFCNWAMGLYEIEILYGNGSIKLWTIDENRTPLIANFHWLRIHHKLKSKKEFNQNLPKQAELDSLDATRVYILLIPFVVQFSKRRKWNQKKKLMVKT